MQLISIILWAISLFISFPLAYLAVELACGLRPLPSFTRMGPTAIDTVILIPAHNEELGIGATVSGLRSANGAQFRVLVVADNCTDQTAALAREAGAEVIERQDANRRGKGFALSFGRDHLRDNPPTVVIVVDADCQLSQGTGELLAAHVLRTGEPAQATNLVVSSGGASPIVQISNFAMLIKNVVRARGLERIGGGGLLLGTGMAFPWDLFEAAPLATSNVVEDMQLGIALALGGVRVHFIENARVVSAAANLADTAGQRRRWEHGFLQTAMKHALPLILHGIERRSMHLAALGLHLLVPPLALLFLLTVGTIAAGGFFAVLTGIAGPMIVAGVFLVVGSVLLVAAWRVDGRAILSVRALMSIPLYALWKVPIYVGFLISRQTRWNRTRRDGDSDAN